MATYQLIYYSTTVKPWSIDELMRLIVPARVFNEQHGITGVLFYAGQRFLQLLEGEKDVVHELYGRICRDVRHTHITLVLDGPAPERLFPNWSMGCGAVATAALTQLARYLDPRHQGSLVPVGYNVQEVIIDLLQEFTEEQHALLTDPYHGEFFGAQLVMMPSNHQPPKGNSASFSHGPLR